jgi:hypothetical protein
MIVVYWSDIGFNAAVFTIKHHITKKNLMCKVSNMWSNNLSDSLLSYVLFKTIDIYLPIQHFLNNMQRFKRPQNKQYSDILTSGLLDLSFAWICCIHWWH